MQLYDAYNRTINQTDDQEFSAEQRQDGGHDEPTNERTNYNAKNPHVAATPKPLPKGKDEEQSTYSEKNYKLQKLGIWIQLFLCIFTALAFVAAAYYAYAAHEQKTIMDSTLNEIIKQTKSAQASAAGSLLSGVNGSIQSMLSGKSLIATIEEMRTDQRAWLSVLKIDVPMEIGKPLGFTVHIVNTGKTPARNVVSRIVAEPVLRGKNPV